MYLIPPAVEEKKEELYSYMDTLGIASKNIQNSDLFLTAFIHKSYAADFKVITSHNERLEFLGDGILGATVCKLLFQNYPEMPESEMTLYKIALVREETLAEVAREIGLDQRIFISKGEEHAQGRKKDTILWDAFEALLGYLYLDFWEEEVSKFVENHLYPKIKQIKKQPIKSYKTLVQEYTQKEHKITPEYQESEMEREGKDNTFLYKSELLVAGEVKSEGFGANKKKAQEDAAKNYYEKTII